MSNADKSKTTQPTRYFALLEGGRRVDIEEVARELAHSNRPETAATDPTETETAVIRQHDQDHVRKVEETNGVINERAAAFRHIEQRLPSAIDLENHIHHAETEAEAELASHPELVRLRKDERSALRT